MEKNKPVLQDKERANKFFKNFNAYLEYGSLTPYIELNQFFYYMDKAIDRYLQSWKFKWGTDEWMICRLWYRTYRKKAFSFIEKQWTN